MTPLGQAQSAEIWEHGRLKLVVTRSLARATSKTPEEVLSYLGNPLPPLNAVLVSPLLAILKRAAKASQVPESERYLISDALAEAIKVPADLIECLRLCWEKGTCPLANQVKRGLALAFVRFNALELAECPDQPGLQKILFLCHVKPKDKIQAEVFRRIAKGENILSGRGE